MKTLSGDDPTISTSAPWTRRANVARAVAFPSGQSAHGSSKGRPTRSWWPGRRVIRAGPSSRSRVACKALTSRGAEVDPSGRVGSTEMIAVLKVSSVVDVACGRSRVTGPLPDVGWLPAGDTALPSFGAIPTRRAPSSRALRVRYRYAIGSSPSGAVVPLPSGSQYEPLPTGLLVQARVSA